MDQRYLLLIESIEKAGILKTASIKNALMAVDRKDFVIPEYIDHAYDDRALPIGEGQTISQPSTVVFMLELLQAEKGHKILDAGSGSGWTTALLAHLSGHLGRITAMEILDSLRVLGEKTLEKPDVTTLYSLQEMRLSIFLMKSFLTVFLSMHLLAKSLPLCFRN